MFQEFLIKLSKKNKIIIVLFIGSIFLIFFTLSKKSKQNRKITTIKPKQPIQKRIKSNTIKTK